MKDAITCWIPQVRSLSEDEAINKQKNISMDIQTEIGELEELFEVIDDDRKNWIMIEYIKNTS